MSGGDIRCSAVIVAAGSAQRMQGIDKLLAPLDSVPVLRRTVEALASAPEITELIVVTRADRLEAVQALCEGLSKPVSVVPGGKTRAESVLCGLSAAAMPWSRSLTASSSSSRSPTVALRLSTKKMRS